MRISTFALSGTTNLTCRATFVKGDMYIRDMKNTSYVPFDSSKSLRVF